MPGCPARLASQCNRKTAGPAAAAVQMRRRWGDRSGTGQGSHRDRTEIAQRSHRDPIGTGQGQDGGRTGTGAGQGRGRDCTGTGQEQVRTCTGQGQGRHGPGTGQRKRRDCPLRLSDAAIRCSGGHPARAERLRRGKATRAPDMPVTRASAGRDPGQGAPRGCRWRRQSAADRKAPPGAVCQTACQTVFLTVCQTGRWVFAMGLPGAGQAACLQRLPEA